MADNSTLIKFQRIDSVRNFSMMQYTFPEVSFEDNLSEEEILCTIEEESHQSKFNDFLGKQLENHGKKDDALFHHW